MACFFINAKGQQFSCKWLIDACTNDPTCKQLHDDWKEECNALINWTIHSKGPPICTDECKKANDDFKKHKIWRRSIDCNCGNINDNVELKEIRETEKCLRQRFTLSAFCDKGIFIECPKGEYTYISDRIFWKTNHNVTYTEIHFLSAHMEVTLMYILTSI